MFPTVWILLIVYSRNGSMCSSELCTSCKLIAGSKGLIRLKFDPFGKTIAGGVFFIRRHIKFARLPFCDVSSCWCSMPGSIISLGVANGGVLIPSFLFSFISWSTSTKRCILMLMTWLPSGIAPEGKAGQMLDSLLYLSIFKMPFLLQQWPISLFK